MTSRKVKTRIDELLQAGTEIRRTKTGGVRLGTIQLLKPNGQKTASGTYIESKGHTLPSGTFDPTQAPERVGNTEYVQMRGGGKKVTRRWDPTENDWKFTALGKSFYATLRRNYLIQIPVKVVGKRKDGSSYTLKTWMPMEKLGLTPMSMPLNLTYRQRLARVKATVQGQLDQGALLEFSQETWTLDSGGSWRRWGWTTVRARPM